MQIFNSVDWNSRLPRRLPSCGERNSVAFPKIKKQRKESATNLRLMKTNDVLVFLPNPYWPGMIILSKQSRGNSAVCVVPASERTKHLMFGRFPRKPIRASDMFIGKFACA